MSNFICPVCGEELITNEKSLSCKNNHNYDLAKSGYVNLLLSQQIKAKHHGDDKLMVRARQAFLNKGYYAPLLENILEMTAKYANPGCRILDAGCGECYFTANIRGHLINRQADPQMFAVDISKDALSAGARRDPNIELAVASVFRLPVRDNSCDMLLSIFAPFCGVEFRRVLHADGIMIRAVPLERHLWSLKSAVYASPYENETDGAAPEGFSLLEKREIRETVHLSCNEDIVNVFAMTPYYYKTGAEDQKKLRHLSALDTETQFGIFACQKK